MIRLGALACLLLAVPAQAQDFRGLLPGMATAELARLGEPVSITPLENGTTQAVYPLPYGQRLEVVHAGPDGILALSSYPPLFGEVPQSGGLQARVTTLRAAVRESGSEGWFFETEGQLSPEPSRILRLYYDLPDHVDTVLSLWFHAPDAVPALDGGLMDLPRRVEMVQAELLHTSYIALHPDRFGDTRIQRPDAAPFAPPLSEAFPLIALPLR